MKSIKHYIYPLALSAFFAAGTTSCSDFLKEYSQDLAKVESWTDLDEVLLGDAYLPPAMRSENTGNLDILHFMTDEMVPDKTYEGQYGIGYSDYTQSMFPFYTWMGDTGLNEQRQYSGGDQVYWNGLYKRINVCNMVLELIDEQPEPNKGDAEEKQRVKGEAHFLRGAYYFILANLYSKPYVPEIAANEMGVPVKLTGTIEDVEFSRIPLSDTYAQIIRDLDEAERLLEGKNRKSVYRTNLTATNLLQSRVYLYMQDWEKAAEYAQKVLNTQNALLDLRTKSPGENCVYKNSPETIFSMGGYSIASAFADTEGLFDYYRPSYYVSDEMQNLYSDNDLRKNLYIGNSVLMDLPGVFRKYNGQYGFYGTYGEVSSSFLLRTPEAYLTYAEAKAFLGEETESCRILSQFLATRMEGDATVNLTGNDLIDLIREERAREFLLEGHRWFDLRRYTVCQPYPWSKTITHEYIFYQSANWPYSVDYIESYVLEKNDPAYTLPVPRSVLNFQISLGSISRPDRQPTRIEPDDEDEDDDDDWY